MLIVALLLSGWYIYYLHQQNIQDRIYSVGDTIPFSVFDLKITGVDKQQIPLNISRDDLILIDCDSLSYGYNYAAGAPYNEHGWNNKRECMKYHEAKQYLDDYDIRMKVEYEVSAKDTVRGNALGFTVLPDSGRKIDLNAGSDTGHDQYSFLRLMGVHYNANPASDFGGNLNRGLTRSGYVSADMRRDEQSIDIQVHYGNESRIIRLSR